jgi:hypothetical protein
MTYGDHVSDVRVAMTTLLQRHRVLVALGGANGGTAPNRTTEAEKQVLGAQIQRYRYVVLAWSTAAIDGVAPKFAGGSRHAQYRSPVDPLLRRLGDSVGELTCGYPSMEELAQPSENKLVETWRQAARACVLSEVDMGSVAHHKLDAAQARAVLKDAADFVRGLVVLDRRYANVPGWHHLFNAGHLENAAEVVSVFARWSECDFSVDTKGWRTPPAAIKGPPLPGLAGVVQAQHNMLVDLSGVPPTGMNMRRIFGSQTGLCHELTRQAAIAAPELVETFQRREETYRLLGHESRNFGGLIGNGGPAAAESANAYGRAKAIQTCTPEDAAALHEVARLFDGTDTRIASTIERGFQERIYFASVARPGAQGPVRAGERWVPVTSAAQSKLLPIVRERLRPASPVAAGPQAATPDRMSYEAVLSVQPGVAQRPAPGR